MILGVFILFIYLIFIVLAAHIFCNALEHLGEKLKLSEGVTGSIFASVGTALPETIIPILSIANFSSSNANATNFNHEIGIGAILGAPLMLSTLSLFVMALSILKQRGLNGKISPESSGLKRDLQFFLFSYSIAFLAIFVQKTPQHQILNAIITTILGLSYFIYVMLTVKSSSKLCEYGNQTTAESPLLLTKIGLKLNNITIVLQLIFALTTLIYSANNFISSVNVIVKLYHVSPFLLSLIIIPIATEMPEKINSIIWLRNKKDTLAISNITGAMVFQGSLLPVLGILFTNWSLDSLLPIIGIAITIIATFWFYSNVLRNNIRVWHFGVNGLLYIINILFSLYTIS
jgi:cation:H+ antiporter